MLIISPIKREGIYNMDKICHMCIKELMSADNEVMYSIMISGEPALPGFIGEWETKEKAEEAMDKIVRAYHENHRVVELT